MPHAFRKSFRARFSVATNGRPGPVVIALPEDMLTDRVVVADAPAFEPVETWPGLTDMSRLQKMLWAAKKPIMLLGGSRWSEKAVAATQRFAERFDLPVATTFRRQHLFDQTHRNYAGDLGIGANPKLLARIKDADLVILVGGRMGEMPSQSYTLFDIPAPQQTFVHVHPGSDELGRVYCPAWRSMHRRRHSQRRWKVCRRRTKSSGRTRHRTANADYRAFTDKATDVPGAVNLGEIMVWLRDISRRTTSSPTAPAIMPAGCNRFYRFRKFNTFYGPTSGSMGYGVPAAHRRQAALSRAQRCQLCRRW